MMQFTPRCLMISALLCAAAAAQAQLNRFVEAEAPPVVPALVAPLAELPRELGPWHGTDIPVPPGVPLGDDRVHRLYRNTFTGQAVTVWITFAADGADRAHYPQICMAVAGKSEDVARRADVALADGGAPLAESCFGSTGDGVRTWYWHYALATPRRTANNSLARTYYRARQRSASVTLELLASDAASPSAATALREQRQLAVLVDTSIRKLLPAGAVRGSDRLPVGETQ